MPKRMNAPSHIGRVIQNAITFNARYWGRAEAPMEEIIEKVQHLFALLKDRKIHYVLVGGIALLQYIQGRNTEDIDIIVNLAALKKLPEITITIQDIYFARGNYQGLQIDFLLTKNPLFTHVRKNHVIQQPFFEQNIQSATIRGLVLLKLYALPSLYRQGNFARIGLYENDVATLMFYHTPNMQEILEELSPFISAQDRTAIEAIVSDLAQRIARLKNLTDSKE